MITLAGTESDFDMHHIINGADSPWGGINMIPSFNRSTNNDSSSKKHHVPSYKPLKNLARK
jgi:hypothetical protein